MEIIRVALLGITGILLAIIVKEMKPAYASYIVWACSVMLLFYSIEKVMGLFTSLKALSDLVPVETAYLTILLKMLGITCVGQFSSALCKDAGYSSVANQIELFGRLSILALSMPVVTALLETIHEFLG